MTEEEGGNKRHYHQLYMFHSNLCVCLCIVNRYTEEPTNKRKQKLNWITAKISPTESNDSERCNYTPLIKYVYVLGHALLPMFANVFATLNMIALVKSP